MNDKYKYLIVMFFFLYSISSYSQRLVVEDGYFHVEAYGMNKDILAVTAAQQAMRRNPDNGSTLTPSGQSDIGGYINRIISAKFKISQKESSYLLNWDEAVQYCADMEPAGTWRLPTLNEALMMIIFYDQMKPKIDQGLGDAVPDFELPAKTANQRQYATATFSGFKQYFYRWELINMNGLRAYYGTTNRSYQIYARCISDVPQ